jgi:hypothetical protein
MKTFGMNPTLVESFKNIMPTRNLAYFFDGTMPADFNSLGFPQTAAGLIENCKNACVITSYFTDNRNVNFVNAGSLIKSGDLVAVYRGEVVSVKDGASNPTAFDDHLIYYPRKITCKNDYRDHNTFMSVMYKMQGDYGFDGLDTFIARTTENDETIEFEYDTPRAVNCFGIKQSTTAAQVMYQFHIEYWNGSAWTLIDTSPINQIGYWIVKFAEITATRFRIRKVSTTGTAANIDLAFAYFGKFGFSAGDIRKNVAVPQYAIIVPEHISAATYTNLLSKQNDTYGNRNQNTEHLIMCSAGLPSQSVYMKMNAPTTDEYNKYNYYLVVGQII